MSFGGLPAGFPRKSRTVLPREKDRVKFLCHTSAQASSLEGCAKGQVDAAEKQLVRLVCDIAGVHSGTQCTELYIRQGVTDGYAVHSTSPPNTKKFTYTKVLESLKSAASCTALSRGPVVQRSVSVCSEELPIALCHNSRVLESQAPVSNLNRRTLLQDAQHAWSDHGPRDVTQATCRQVSCRERYRCSHCSSVLVTATARKVREVHGHLSVLTHTLQACLNV